jgi:acyl-CoA reductase-like NAD-dependent aldehyde dehydrogenase
MSIFQFPGEEEVIARANAIEFRLAAGVFTQDIARAHRVIDQIEAGTCWISAYDLAPVQKPFGAVKFSGLGVRIRPQRWITTHRQSRSMWRQILWEETQKSQTV